MAKSNPAGFDEKPPDFTGFQGEIPHGKISQAKPELNGMIGNCIAFDKSPRTQLIPSKIFEIAPHMMRAQNGDDPQIPWLMI
jgi:hypothetical protein